jgi:hypothetical protein
MRDLKHFISGLTVWVLLWFLLRTASNAYSSVLWGKQHTGGAFASFYDGFFLLSQSENPHPGFAADDIFIVLGIVLMILGALAAGLAFAVKYDSRSYATKTTDSQLKCTCCAVHGTQTSDPTTEIQPTESTETST